MANNDKRNQSFETNSEVIPMMELVDKDIRTVVIIVFRILKNLGEILNMLSRYGRYDPDQTSRHGSCNI